ncbi:unnamed protein product [Symbiodinium microadriaticum]|nr:unnamed protein product [Symbiodinium microadriaticum]
MEKDIKTTLDRIAAALDRLAPPPAPMPDWQAAAYVWETNQHTDQAQLRAVPEISRIRLDLLKGIDLVRDLLLENTQRFAKGFAANNALLWGARGMGKSSLVKAVHAHVRDAEDQPLILVEIHREDIITLPHLMDQLRGATDKRFILFCDDLSFDAEDQTYKSLKAVLEGGIEGRPDHVIFYATSNRRHLLPRHMMENERSTAINPSEAVEEKVSLSDRFGLWLGFHNCTQDTYLSMIDSYVQALELGLTESDWRADALEWSTTRGARSGRVAWQFVQDLAGRLGKTVKGLDR